MKTNKILSIVLIIVGLLLGGYGFTTMDDNTKSLEIGSLEISASNEEGKTKGILMMVGGLALVAFGAMSAKR